MVTWELPFVFRTPPDYGLAVNGPANHEKSGIVALDAFVRTDWLPFPFTLNWRLTEADRTVRFEAGEPIGRIYPYPLGVLDEFEIKPARFEQDPEFHRKFREWSEARKQGYQNREAAREQLQQGGEDFDLEARWNQRYVRGQGVDDDVKHQTVFRCKPIKSRTRGS